MSRIDFRFSQVIIMAGIIHLMLYRHVESHVLVRMLPLSLFIVVQYASTVVFLLLSFCVTFRIPTRPGLEGLLRRFWRWYHWGLLATALLASWLFLYTVDHSARSFGYQLGYPRLLIIGGLYILFLALTDRLLRQSCNRSRGPYAALMIMGVALSLLASTVVILFIPLIPEGSDTLPLISAAAEELLGGKNPYGAWYQLSDGAAPLPLTYLPGMWLPYVPLVFAGVDVRVLGIPAAIVILSLLYALAKESMHIWTPLLLTVAFSPFFSPRSGIYEYPYWLLLALACFLLIKGTWYPASVCLGLALASRQMVAFLIPFYLLLLIRKGGKLLALKNIVVVLAAATFLIAPFMRTDPEFFLHGTFYYFQKQAAVSVSFGRVVEILEGFSLVTLLRPLDMSRYLQVAQVVVIALLWTLALFRLRSVSDCLSYMALAYVAFLMLNPLVWTYLYSAPILILVFAVLSQGSAFSSPVRTEGAR